MIMVSVIAVSVLSLAMVFIVATGRACPGLSSDQVIASGTVRFAGCSKATDAWSKATDALEQGHRRLEQGRPLTRRPGSVPVSFGRMSNQSATFSTGSEGRTSASGR